MNLLDVVKRSKFLPQGCKLYYATLYNRNIASTINNWRILNGPYKNHTFVIALDQEIAEDQGVTRTSIHNYKKKLKSLGLIDTIKKLTTRTNICKNNHYYQLTIVSNKLPRKFIAKILKRPVAFFKAKLQKTYNHIISQSKHKINKVCKNLQARVRKIAEKIKPANNISNKLYTDDNHYKCESYLLEYNVNYKYSDLEKYAQLYIESPDKFISACIASSNMDTYSPYNYFVKVYNNPFEKQNYTYTKPYKNKNSFSNFPQRNYDYKELEKLLIENYYGED